MKHALKVFILCTCLLNTNIYSKLQSQRPESIQNQTNIHVDKADVTINIDTLHISNNSIAKECQQRKPQKSSLPPIDTKALVIHELDDGVDVRHEVEQVVQKLFDQGVRPHQILFISDIDNTILKPWGGLAGSDQWFDWNMTSLKAQGKTRTQALEITLEKLARIQPHVMVEPVDIEMANVINNLQKQGVMTLGLTARDSSFAQATIRQLKDKKIGVDFTKGLPRHSKWMQNARVNSTTVPKYRGGILFCAGKNKGKALLRLLELKEYKPTYIVFVDDKEKNIRNVQEALAKVGLPGFLIHYTETHPEVAQFIKVQEILAEKSTQTRV